MGRLGIVAVMFFLSACVSLANDPSSSIAKEMPWPARYQGDTVPVLSGDISIPIPKEVDRVIQEDKGIAFVFTDGSVIDIIQIDGDFYKSDENPEGITSKNKISVSFAGKIPFTYDSVPENLSQADVDWWIWRYALASKVLIFSKDNVVNKLSSGEIQIHCYYSLSRRSPIVANVHSKDESRYLMVTGSGISAEKFFNILGGISTAR